MTPTVDPQGEAAVNTGFCEPLWLAGWSERSIWGYDQPMATFFAQLWQDDNFDEDPLWIGGFHPVDSASGLAGLVAEATASPIDEVLGVLHTSRPT
jgi:hypothetical protein